MLARRQVLPLIYWIFPQKSVPRASVLVFRWPARGVHEHRSNELSGGQVQRVVIVRAGKRPGGHFCRRANGQPNSATSEMVPDYRFKSMQERGRTIVLITHGPETAFLG